MHHGEKYLDPALRELWHYNPDTGIFTSKIKTYGAGGPVGIGDAVGTIRSDGYVQLGHRGKTYRAHVLAWVWMTGELPPKGKEVDHRNTIANDNYWSNLRLVRRGANVLNHKGPRSDNTSGARGVYRNRDKGFFARITVDGEIVHLGTYSTYEAAVAARKKAEAIYWQMQAEDTF